MKAFKRRGGDYVATFEPEEARVLLQLTAQVTELLDEPDTADAAVMRLLPDAYHGDPEAADEFRRFTSESLVERKVRNARVIGEAVAAVAVSARPEKVTVSGEDAQAWIRGLSDIRLTIAARLGIETDADEVPWHEPVAQIYQWLAFVQESLVRVLR